MSKGPKKYKKKFSQKKQSKSSLGNSPSANTYIRVQKQPNDVAKQLNDKFHALIELPTWLEEVEVLCRKQQKLQAIKMFARHSKLGIAIGKKAVDDYCENGDWEYGKKYLDGIEMTVNIFEMTFAEQFKVEEMDHWKGNLELHKTRFRWLMNRNKPDDDYYYPFFNMNELKLFSMEYARRLVDQRTKDIFEYIKENEPQWFWEGIEKLERKNES